MSPLNRRSNYFIDKRLQGIWALLNLIIAGILGLLIGFEIIRSFYSEFGWPLADRPFLLPDLIFIIKLLILALVGSGFFWLLSAFAGHKIAGPIYKLDQSMKKVAKGDYGLRIQFRKKDFFKHISETFNEMTESVEKDIKEKNEKIEKVRTAIQELPQDNPKVKELKELLR